MLTAQAPEGTPTAEAVMARAGRENFPVAIRLLPRRTRRDLLAIYGFARLVDELGDSFDGDRPAALDWIERDLDRAFEGRAEHPLLVALQPALRERRLPRAPFLRLIEANRVDQRVTRYATWEQLRGYCGLSADPVGELVLWVFGAATPRRIELSDSICTALQLIEHCQDVAEDLARGRVYLPEEDLERFGCAPQELAAPHAGPALRAVLAFEAARARALLAEGAPLLGELNGRARLAVAAFVAGGRASVDAIERAGYDVLAGAPRATRPAFALELARTLAPGAPAHADATMAAYAHCEAVTRREAANFYWGIRLLAVERRRAMCAAYAFARRIDDIGDGSLGREQKRARLDEQAAALAAVERSPGAPVAGGDPVMVALADAYARFPLPPGALGELIEGVRMDVEEVAYETFDELVLYCRRVAGAIGRVCLAIFGLRAGASASGAERLADDLGVALQLTNILRDLREDAGNGRVYVPGEDLRRFGIGGGEGAAQQLLTALDLAPQGDRGPQGPQPTALVRFEAARAREWFDRGLALAPLLDRRSAACLLAMAGIYRRLLERIEASPQQAMRGRMSLPASEKAWVAARGIVGAAP